MNKVKADDRIKVRQYVFERCSLTEFTRNHADQFDYHVQNAIKQRIRIIDKELKMLGMNESEVGSTDEQRARS